MVLSGDVHHAYLSEVEFRLRARASGSRVYQAVCSPYRNPLAKGERTGRASRVLALVHGSHPRRWRGSPGRPTPGSGGALLEGPYFDNQVATVRLDGRDALDPARQDDRRRGGPERAGKDVRAPDNLSGEMGRGATRQKGAPPRRLFRRLQNLCVAATL